jgi:hypothetical protein
MNGENIHVFSSEEIPIPQFDATIDYYSILNLTIDATVEDIKTSYRKMVKETHPDTAGKEKRDHFEKIHKSYSILKNPVARKSYDEMRDKNPFKSIGLPIINILQIQKEVWLKYKSVILSPGRLQDWQIAHFESQTVVVDKYLISLDPLLSVCKEVVLFISRGKFDKKDALKTIDSWGRKKLGNLNETELEVLKTLVICALYT